MCCATTCFLLLMWPIALRPCHPVRLSCLSRIALEFMLHTLSLFCEFRVIYQSLVYLDSLNSAVSNRWGLLFCVAEDADSSSDLIHYWLLYMFVLLMGHSGWPCPLLVVQVPPSSSRPTLCFDASALDSLCSCFSWNPGVCDLYTYIYIYICFLRGKQHTYIYIYIYIY